MADARNADREFDLVLFGATGFTGQLTAEYLARHAPAGLRWALAGRSPDRLARVRDRLAELDPELKRLELLPADVTDPTSLADVAGRARVVITTVGPYLTYGEPLVAACAEAGTDYVDLTGEPRAASTRSRTTSGRCSRSSSSRPPDRCRCAVSCAPAACSPAAPSTPR